MTATECQDPSFSQQNIDQGINTASISLSFSHSTSWCYPHDVQENMSHPSSPPSSTDPCSSFDACVHCTWCILWPVCIYASPLTLYSDTFLSMPLFTFSAHCATEALLWDGTRLGSPHKPCDPMTWFPFHRLFFLEELLVGTNPCIPGTSHKTCCAGDALTQSSRHTVCPLFKIALILILAHFSCFQL